MKILIKGFSFLKLNYQNMANFSKFSSNFWKFSMESVWKWEYPLVFRFIIQRIFQSCTVWEMSYVLISGEGRVDSVSIKDHIYRMVKVEGRCTQLTSSSLHTYIIIGWHKSIVSSDWSDTMVWFGQILLLLYFYHPIYDPWLKPSPFDKILKKETLPLYQTIKLIKSSFWREWEYPNAIFKYLWREFQIFKIRFRSNLIQ